MLGFPPAGVVYTYSGHLPGFVVGTSGHP